MIHILRPPGKVWDSYCAVPNSGKYGVAFLRDTLSIESAIVNEPDDDMSKNYILWYGVDGDPCAIPYSMIFDGTLFNDIPNDWIDLMNAGRMSIVVSTIHEASSPEYDGLLNFVDYKDLHKTLANAAHKLGIPCDRITWLTGDLNAEDYLRGKSEISVKSHCVFMHSIVCDISWHDGVDYSHFYHNRSADEIEYSFIFLNRYPKMHRAYALKRLWELHDFSFGDDTAISFENSVEGFTATAGFRELWHCKYYYQGGKLDKTDLIDWDRDVDIFAKLVDTILPLRLDNVDKNNDSCLGVDAMTKIKPFYNKSMISLVGETSAHGGRLFISDATIFNILNCVPFIVIGNRGTLAKLRDYGFLTFNDVWDEGYDMIHDDVARWEAAVQLLNNNMNKFRDNKQLLVDKCAPIIEHNYNHLLQLSRSEENKLKSWLESL